MSKVYVVYTNNNIDGCYEYTLSAYNTLEKAKERFNLEVSKVRKDIGNNLEYYKEDIEDLSYRVYEDGFAAIDDTLICVKELEVQ